MKTDKPFDCVEMKHLAAEIVQARLEQMTPDEQQAYWDQLTRQFQEKQSRQRHEKYGDDYPAVV